MAAGKSLKQGQLWKPGMVSGMFFGGESNGRWESGL